LRYSKAHVADDGNSARYWWGVPRKYWVAKEFVFLICGGDGVLVAPMEEWSEFRDLIPKSADGKVLHPSAWCVRSHGKVQFELRHAGERIDVTAYLHRYDLYADQTLR
jgi:hypothetical protein